MTTATRHCAHCGGQREYDPPTGRCMGCGRLPNTVTTAPPRQVDRARFARHSPSGAYRTPHVHGAANTTNAVADVAPDLSEQTLTTALTAGVEFDAVPLPGPVAEHEPDYGGRENWVDPRCAVCGVIRSEHAEVPIFGSPTFKRSCTANCGGFAVTLAGHEPPSDCAFCGSPLGPRVPLGHDAAGEVR
jgi:hypothetical protein